MITHMQDTAAAERRHRHHRRHGLKSRVYGFLRSYRVEISIALLIAFGAFLLLEKVNIRESLAGWLRRLGTAAIRDLDSASAAVSQFMHRLTLSDAVGGFLILVAFLAIVWRVRWQLMRAPALTGEACPQCGGRLVRVHRRTLERLVSAIVPLRRYRCTNRQCGWRGLRVTSATEAASSVASDR
jgi:hypothetical protein